VDEHDHGAVAFAGWSEDVEPVALVRAVGQVAAERHAVVGRRLVAAREDLARCRRRVGAHDVADRGDGARDLRVHGRRCTTRQRPAAR
jgi:hypothetical protein